MTIYTDWESFDIAHNEQCDCSESWNSNGPHENPGASCPQCNAWYEEGTYFNAGANPSYDDAGNVIGSGEWQELTFRGEL